MKPEDATYGWARLNDVTVNACHKANIPLEKVVAILAAEKRDAYDRLIDLAKNGPQPLVIVRTDAVAKAAKDSREIQA